MNTVDAAAVDARRHELVGPSARLVEFLRELVRTGRPSVFDIEQYDDARWLDGLPVGTKGAISAEAGPGEVIFSIDPVVSEPPPPPPDVITPWLGPVDDSFAEQPHLELEDAPPEQTDELVLAYNRWVALWQMWAEADRRVAGQRDWFNTLASMSRHLEQQDDVYEVVVGTGILNWAGEGRTIRHPLLTTRVELLSDPATGRIDVIIPPDAVTRIADRVLLDQQPGFDASRAEELRDELRGLPAVPLSDAMKEVLTRWRALSLQRCRPYDHTWEPPASADTAPDLRFAPVLIFRERDRTSLIDYFDQMLDALSGAGATAPLGLAQLLTALEPEERMEWLEREGAATGDALGEDPLFPLASNPEQRQIIDRLRSDNGVVVMGPPGTGKTHTIANLLSALLARGQRVLVTSQKAQALRVLRDKLPAEMQQLCVSMTDLARGGSTELNESVNALSDRYSDFSPVAYEQRVAGHEATREGAQRDTATLRERIRSLREAETYVHPPVAAGYEGTKGAIAAALNREAPRCSWMPVPLPEDAPSGAPLDVAEIVDLRRLLVDETPQRAARPSQDLPSLDSLPSTVTVQGLISDEAAAARAADAASSELSETLAAVGPDGLERLRYHARTASAALHDLRLPVDDDGHVQGPASPPPMTPSPGHDRVGGDWRRRALDACLTRREAWVWTQLGTLGSHAHNAQQQLEWLGMRQVTLPAFDPAGPRSLHAQLQAGRALAAHMAAGNELKRRLRPPVQKEAEHLLDGALVDGTPVSNLALLNIVMARLEAEQVAASLAGRWSSVGVDLDPTLPLERRVAQLVDLATDLNRVLSVTSARDQAEQELGRVGVLIPMGSLDEWSTFSDTLAAVDARLAAERASEKLAELATTLERQAQAPTAPPELARLATAVATRDRSLFDATLDDLAGAFGEQADQRRCDELLARLRSAHPVLADQLRATADQPYWDDRLAVFPAAWAWGLARSFFDRLREPGLEDRLAAELGDAVDRERRATAALAAEAAWGRCLGRMSAHQEQALRSYRANIDDRGAGTGKWAGRYAAAAREAMIEARGAVPAWIMPLREVIETIPPDANSFDVVIIDEASQASIEALFLLWLAPRVIVVGDERQCAPSQVGRGQLQPIFDRLDDYLAQVPEYLRLAFTPKSNLFSLLQTRFGAVIRLREHFRCMPEIIGWSSQQFYADAPLVPLRQYGADRLPPLRRVHVPGAVTEGRSSRLTNRAEAEALVAQVLDCNADPAYDGRTFGVVVLQGSGQVRQIEDLLADALPPADWERRHLRVGTPPDFQGDERSIMFLSMVVAERPRAVTYREWQRRFNVAASRARDQMWLFHSVTPDLLSPKDLRRSLLTYVLNPPAPMSSAGLDHLRWDSELEDPFQSKFEQRVFVALRDRGYAVTPQVEVNGRFIDLVVTGAQGRLAVECDGDRWHSSPADQLADLDREQELRRAGWQFWRVRESEFNLDPDEALSTLWETLDERGIRPGDLATASGSEDNAVDPLAPRWDATELMDEEGLDGLDAFDDSDDLDRPIRPRPRRPQHPRPALPGRTAGSGG